MRQARNQYEAELWLLPDSCCFLAWFTQQETHYVSAAKINRLTLFGEKVSVYCENCTKHRNPLCGQNVKFCCVKAGIVKPFSQPGYLVGS
jgi:hypothetical protein